MKHVMLIAVLFASSIGIARAAVPPAAPAPTATYDVGSLHVDQYGRGGAGAKSIVFIPGLTMGPYEWSGEIARLAPTHTIYALTLPGFDGRPPLQGTNYFDVTTADFWKLLAQKAIAKPVVIGHSLGGTMGFMLATQHPELLGGVIAVDGLPIFPGNDLSTPEQVKAAAEKASQQMAAQSHDAFATYEREQVLPSLMTSPADVAAIAPLVATSDQKATAEWFREDLELDLRPQLPKADVPILLIGPYDATVDGRFFPNADVKRAYYARLVSAAPHATVQIIPNSRHFIMYDRPQALSDAIDAFLAGH